MTLSFLKWLTAVLFIGFSCVPMVSAAGIDIRFDTTVRSDGRRADSGEDKSVLPLCEYLGANNGDAKQNGLSFHIYDRGRKYPAGSNFHVEDPEGELLSRYNRYQKPYGQFDASIGRQYLLAGVANQSVNGLRLTTGIGPYLSASIFGGLHIDYRDQDSGSADAANGTRLAHNIADQSEIGLSYQKNQEEVLAVAGTDIVWRGLGIVDVGVRQRHYDYDRRQESALYMAGLLTVNTSSGSQIGVEIGRMDGEAADNIYNLYRGFFCWQQPLRMKTQGFISGHALYIAYDAPVYGEEKSIQYSVSAGRHFFNNRMETKLSGIFSQAPYFDNDVGGVVTLQIHY